MDPRAERTLKIVVIDDYDFRIRISADRASLHIDFLHFFGVRVLGQIHFGHPYQRLLVFGQQEFQVLLLAVAIERDGYGIVIGKFAGAGGRNDDLYACGYVVRHTKLALNPLRKLSWRKLRRAAQTDHQENKESALARHHQIPPDHEELPKLSHRAAPEAGRTTIGREQS